MKMGTKSTVRVALAAVAMAVLVTSSAQTTPVIPTGKTGWTCGCLDGENNFYPGPSGAGYCWETYQAEPWCVP